MGVAFAFSMYLETQASRQFAATTQARYLAEGGVSHARALLDEDRLGSRVDDGTEFWASDLAGADADVDGDGTAESRWWPVTDATERAVGRYAVRITDEAGKVNLNAAHARGVVATPGAPDLTRLLEQAGIPNAPAMAEAIERYRHGVDERPGQAGVDDDGDGAIDETDEYQPLALLGDDRRLEGLEELGKIAKLDAEAIRRLARLATVHSWDLNVTVGGKPRVNVNTATAEELLGVLLEAGVADPWQAAVNIADYVDADHEMSRVTKSSQLLAIPSGNPVGGWTWRDAPEGHYASEEPGEGALVWSVPVPTGTFRLLARGLDGAKIGDMAVGGQQRPSVNDGESLGVFQLSNTLEVRVVNREAAGTACAFRGLELVSESAQAGVGVRGIEAVRIHELMVDPTASFDVAEAVFDPQGSDWACPIGAGVCSNSGVAQARWSWTSSVAQPGRYYLRVFGSSVGQTVGDVRVEGLTQRLVHGERHPSTVLVGSDGKISVTIGKTVEGGTYYLRSISLSLQPDGEYVELINLSDQAVNVGGWTLEGELTGGQQARLPAGAQLAPHGLLIAAVDLDDADGQPSEALGNNGIDARSAWEISPEANAVQLEFPGGAPSPDTDWLKTALSDEDPRRLLLKAQGLVVDEVQYLLPLATTGSFQSLEKGDPTVVEDRDEDGIDDGWYPSLQLYTPGSGNDNDGLKEVRDLKTIIHDPLDEVTVLNRPLGGVGELAGFASGSAWEPFSSTDLAKIVDRLTIEGYQLEAEEHFIGAPGPGAWEEQMEGSYLHTDPQQADAAGQWRWVGIPDGNYRFSLYSCAGCEGEQMALRWQGSDSSWSPWSPPLSTDTQGRLVIGQLTVGVPDTPAQTLVLEVKCLSPDGICHFDHAQLDPQLIRIGPVNINTASTDVLLTLPGVTDAVASRMIAGRPYGDQDGKGQGIGDLLAGDVLGTIDEDRLALFRALGHLVTVHSDVFEITSLGQAAPEDRLEASQRIHAVVQR